MTSPTRELLWDSLVRRCDTIARWFFMQLRQIVQYLRGRGRCVRVVAIVRVRKPSGVSFDEDITVTVLGRSAVTH